MTLTTAHVIDPIDRFEKLLGELEADHAESANSAWWRYAAQLATLRPADPAGTAQAIRAMLMELRDRCGWGDIIQRPFGQMVAAMLVQLGDTAQGFLDELVALRRMLHEAGLPHSTWYELKAALALRALADGGPIATHATVRRLRDIYAAMRTHHWWLVGRDDLPYCALLTSRHGDPSAIAEEAETIYQALAAGGAREGQRLQCAASILPLAAIDPGTIAKRYLDLRLAITEAGLPRDEDTYATDAMLALLDHPGDVIARRFSALYADLDCDDPVVRATAFTVAADLCFIELARLDPQLRLRTGEAEVEAMNALLRTQRALSVVTAHVPPTPVIPYGIAPWM